MARGSGGGLTDLAKPALADTELAPAGLPFLDDDGAERQFCVRPSLVGTENCVIVATLDRIRDAHDRPILRWEMRKDRDRVTVEHDNLSRLIAAANGA